MHETCVLHFSQTNLINVLCFIEAWQCVAGGSRLIFSFQRKRADTIIGKLLWPPCSCNRTNAIAISMVNKICQFSSWVEPSLESIRRNYERFAWWFGSIIFRHYERDIENSIPLTTLFQHWPKKTFFNVHFFAYHQELFSTTQSNFLLPSRKKTVITFIKLLSFDPK